MSGTRIRSVKPEWLEDERLTGCSPAARVLSIGLLLLADDYGNGRAGELYLTSRVFAGESRETLAKALEELRRIDFVRLYEVDGQRYYAVRNWAKHQKVDHPGKPLVPAFTPDCQSVKAVSRDPRETLERPSRDSPETLAPDRDRDQDQDQDRRGIGPGPASAGVHAGRANVVPPGAPTLTGPTPPATLETPETKPDPDERETICPLDLLERDGVRVALRELSEHLPCSMLSLEAEAREFLSFWTLGKGMGRQKRNWPRELRERLRKQFHENRLKPPGAVEHERRRAENQRDSRQGPPVTDEIRRLFGPVLTRQLEHRRQSS